MESKFVKVIFKDNWADEMDIEGVEVVLREEFFEKYDKVKEIKGPISVSIGSNEEIDYYEISDFLSSIEIGEVSDEFAEMYNKEIGPVGFIATHLFEEIVGESGFIDLDEIELDTDRTVELLAKADELLGQSNG